MSTTEMMMDAAGRSPTQRRARKLRLVKLAAQRPGQTGDSARAALGEHYRQQAAAKPATKPVRHDFVDDKTIAAGNDDIVPDGACEEKW